MVQTARTEVTPDADETFAIVKTAFVTQFRVCQPITKKAAGPSSATSAVRATLYTHNESKNSLRTLDFRTPYPALR